MRRACGLLLASVLGASSATAQQPVSLDHFDGADSWPLYRPGDLPLDNAALRPQRIAFDGRFPGPQGFGRGPLVHLTLYMDVLDVFFHGEPAVWVQWTSTSPPESSTEAPALDALVVDRATFRLLFRVGRSGPAQAWAGRYEIVHATPDSTIQVSVRDDGSTDRKVLADPGPRFDFATYPFLFPFLDLHEGLSFRLAGYDFVDEAEEILAVRVVGRTRITDATGGGREVWRVDVLPPHRATLITFWVTRQAPFFYGWEYRLTRDGTTALDMTYRGWLPTSMR